MRNIVATLVLALALSPAVSCSDDSDDTMQGNNPATATDAGVPDAGPTLDCKPGYVERCAPTGGNRPVRRCSCVEAG